MDYRKMLSLFKTSVISSKRRLTRMRPNRRFGFDAMGSRYELSTNLLIAVDVSGSVSDRSLSFFFSVINRLFKYGIEKLDVLQFDAKIQGEPELLKKVCKTVKVMGCGGTSFQPAADYYCAHPEYDGLIYFSDGYAPPPKFNTKRPIDVLWVLCGKSAYDANSKWIKELKRNRVTYIPKGE
jgi:predicted metal-dependent peptidase